MTPAPSSFHLDLFPKQSHSVAVNEKIYIFIWFWLLFLGFLSSLVIIYRIVIVFSPYIRAFVLRLRYRWVDSFTFCSTKDKLRNCRRVKKECIDTIIGKSYVGDWFLFYLLGQNIDSVIFKVTIFSESQTGKMRPLATMVNESNPTFLSDERSLFIHIPRLSVSCRVINENLSNMMNHSLLPEASPVIHHIWYGSHWRVNISSLALAQWQLTVSITTHKQPAIDNWVGMIGGKWEIKEERGWYDRPFVWVRDWLGLGKIL